MPQPSTNMQDAPPFYRTSRVLPPVRPYRRAVVWLVLAIAGLAGALWLLGTPPGISGKADAIGYAICHQIADRSFQVNGQPLPLCARCTGIYLGVMVGFVLLSAGGRARASRLAPTRTLVLLALFVVFMGLDGINSYLHLFPGYEGPYEPQNWLRLISGSFTGLAMITLMVPVFNTTVWAQADHRRVLTGIKELAGMLLVIGIVDALVLLRNPLILTGFGLLSAMGPPVILTMVWTILWLTITRRENTARSYRNLILPLIAGLGLAILMIGAIDLIRYQLTGSWEGFDFSPVNPISH